MRNSSVTLQVPKLPIKASLDPGLWRYHLKGSEHVCGGVEGLILTPRYVMPPSVAPLGQEKGLTGTGGAERAAALELSLRTDSSPPGGWMREDSECHSRAVQFWTVSFTPQASEGCPEFSLTDVLQRTSKTTLSSGSNREGLIKLSWAWIFSASLLFLSHFCFFL